MRLVTNVNGKDIYSTKEISSVQGTRITFQDGSWCDVKTGEVENKGTGYIKIGSSPEAKDEVETKTKSFSAKNLQVNGLSGNLTVEVGGSEIKVKVVAPKSMINNINVVHSGDTVIIEDKNSSRGGMTISNTIIGGSHQTVVSGRVRNTTVISGSGNISITGNGICISGGPVIISGEKSSNEVRVNVTVPKGTNVSLANVYGNTEIGDIDGDLQINAKGGDRIHAGRVKNATLNVKGSANITVDSVNGDFVNITCAGSADIGIKGGKTTNLMMGVSGSADVKFGGETHNANLVASGSADIVVNKVTNTPLISESGCADIRIKEYPGR